MTNSTRTMSREYYLESAGTQTYDAEMEPYLSLFLKPLTSKKCEFSKKELAVMCKDPLHSPRLIQYLIEFVKEM
jgi:hypothetical protein